MKSQSGRHERERLVPPFSSSRPHGARPSTHLFIIHDGIDGITARIVRPSYQSYPYAIHPLDLASSLPNMIPVPPRNSVLHFTVLAKSHSC